MKFFFTLLLIAISIQSFSQHNDQLNVTTINGHECVQGELLIKFKKSQLKAANRKIQLRRKTLMEKYSAVEEKKYRIGAEHWNLDTLANNYNLKNTIDSLNAQPDVEYAEPNYIIYADAVNPDDPHFPEQWALNNTGQSGGIEDADIDAPEAWEITTGDPSVIVGVIDAGIDYNHEDLKDNIWINEDEIPNNGIDDDNNGYIDDIHGWDFYNNDNDPMDDNGHGTHVSGIIGAKGNNGIGIAGVAWDCKMMALKFLGSSGGGPISAAIDAVEYATNNGAHVTNNSWGGGGYSRALYQAIQKANNNNVLFVAAAGNSSLNIDENVHYPASYDLENIISVASTDLDDSLSGFSNYGLYNVHIAAPGSSIMSTMPGNTYNVLSGTSMAAPIVTGTIVLGKSVFPDFSNIKLKQHVLGSIDQNASIKDKTIYGGRINCFKSVSEENTLPISVLNRNIFFNAQYVDSMSSAKNLLIRNLLSESITIDSITTSDGFFIKSQNEISSKIFNFPINGKSIDSLEIVFKPASNELKRGLCRIHYSGQSTSSKKLEIFLTGKGVLSGTIVDKNSVTGVWEKSSSPYYINGDIDIYEGNSLEIQPGVKIIFSGHYKFTVHEGAHLETIGRINDTILYTALYPQIGWNGLQIKDSKSIDSLTYCNFSFAKKHNEPWAPVEDFWGGALFIRFSDKGENPLVISDCVFKNNLAISAAAIAFEGDLEYSEHKKIIKNCQFIDNVSDESIIMSHDYSKELYISECDFINNTCHIYYYSHSGIINLQGNGSINNYISNCRFISSKDARDIYSYGPNLVVTNCLFYKSKSERQLCNGGTVSFMQLNIGSAEYTQIYFTNNNFFNNRSSFFKARNGNNVKIQNNIIWGNSRPNLFNIEQNAEKAYIRNNIVQSCKILIGDITLHGETQPFEQFDFHEYYKKNVDIAPLFKDSIHFYFQNSSPAINGGNNSDFLLDSDNTINDIGLNGGNGFVIREDTIDFGTTGINESSDPSTYVLEISNLRNSPIVFDSISFKTKDFILEGNIDFPFTLNSYSTKSINLSFVPSEEKEHYDSLSFYSVDLPKYHSKLPVNGYGSNENTLCGLINTDTLKIENSPYRIICDLIIPEDRTLVINPGVKLEVDPNVNIYIEGNLKINGNKNDSVLITCSNDSMFWGRIIQKPLRLSKNELFSEFTVFEKGQGVFVEDVSNNKSQQTFKYCTFRNFKNHLLSIAPGLFTFSANSSVKFINCYLKYNLTYNFIYCIDGHYSSISFKNCLMHDNEGLVELNRYAEIINSIIIDNNSAISSSMSGRLNIINSIISNSHDYLKNQIGTNFYSNDPQGSQPEIHVKNSYIKNGISAIEIHDQYGDVIEDNSQFVTYENNIETKPEFQPDSYYLEANSTGINAGTKDTTGLNLPKFDLSRKLRIWDETVDIGCYEFGAPYYEQIQICEGNNYKGWIESGTYYDTISSISGADSIIMTELIVNPVYETIIDTLICEGEAYNGWTESAQYTETLTSASGCDSTVTTNLTVLPKYSVTEDVSICQGENHKGWTTSDTYIENLESVNGCDSIVTTNLTVIPKIEIVENVSICEGESYNGWDAEGQYTESFENVNGCDSTVITNLSFYPAYKPEIMTIADTLKCLDTYQTYQWCDMNGDIINATDKQFVIEKSGEYHLVVTDDNGCTQTSDNIFVVKTEASISENFNLKYSIIPNPNQGIFSFKLEAIPKQKMSIKLVNSLGQTIEIRPVDETTEQFDVSHLSKGIYHLVISLDNYQSSEKIVVQ